MSRLLMSKFTLCMKRILNDSSFRKFSEKVEEGKLSEGNLVLKDIQLSISSGEKIAVCGRTGRFMPQRLLLLLLTSM